MERGIVVVTVVVVVADPSYGMIEETGNVTVSVTKNTPGSVRDFAVGSAEAFRAKRNGPYVAYVSAVAETVTTGTCLATFFDDATDVTGRTGCSTFALSCEISSVGSVTMEEGKYTLERSTK